jgi:hypothetical protein
MPRADLLRTVCLPLLCLLLLVVMPFETAPAAESQCARVKIRIEQRLALERQAFDARMSIDNGLADTALRDVEVVIHFEDGDGNRVAASSDPDDTGALFFVRADSPGIGSGPGESWHIDPVPPSSGSELHWLIIPAPGAASGAPNGALYYVGARLSYTISGQERETEVTPDYIRVKPLPQLELDYFLPERVYGDDAFTKEIEPPVPFTLGVLVRNRGNGTARGLKIDSAQPEIVENEQGLLVGFCIEESFVGGEPARESLNVGFGDLQPDAAEAARWVMTCSLSGEFVGFGADFSHADELGGELTALVRSTEAHLLVRDVIADLPGRDGVRDFLAREGDVLRIFESQGQSAPVADESSAAELDFLGQESGARIYRLRIPEAPGFAYARLPDPEGGAGVLGAVTRSDGKRIAADNVWLARERKADPTQGWNHFLHLFDAATPGSYRIELVDPESGPDAPVLGFIPDRNATTGQRLAFLVEASDPDGQVPGLEAAPLPAGAELTDKGDGSGVFSWTPGPGQEGTYRPVFTASDGTLSDSQRVRISVLPAAVADDDGDGLDDGWEREHFGTLARGGAGDYDGDGIPDREEFLRGMNPAEANRAPSIPDIRSPEPGGEIGVARPRLEAGGSEDPDGDAVSYCFEVFAGPALKDLKGSSGEVTPGLGGAAWFLPVAVRDDEACVWRVRAYDGTAYSRWAYGSFFADLENDPPKAPGISRPWDGRETGDAPVLEATNAEDPDDEPVYEFEIYADRAMGQLVARSGAVPEGEGGTTSWRPEAALTDGAVRYWRVGARDREGGEVAWSQLAGFTVNTGNNAPRRPVLASPSSGTRIRTAAPQLRAGPAADPDGDAVYCVFELDTEPAFDSPGLRTSGEIPSGANGTTWSVSGLSEDVRYFWRIKATDTLADSGWRTGSFRVDARNAAPLAPAVRNPGDRAWSGTRTPLLRAARTENREGEELTRIFQIRAPGGALLHTGETRASAWAVPRELPDRSWCSWRVRTRDPRGGESGWSENATLFVLDDGVNDPPEIELLEPAGNGTRSGEVRIRWRDADPDDNATIALRAEPVSAAANATLIVSGLGEDAEGPGDELLWSSLAVADGPYWIRASISDGEHESTARAPGRVLVDNTPPRIAISPSGGAYTRPFNATLSADEPAEIFYTLDGSLPDETAPAFEGPVPVTKDSQLRVLAVDRAGNRALARASYTIRKEIRVGVETGSGDPVPDASVHAFRKSGGYAGASGRTGANGTCVFDGSDFPAGRYRFRADHLGGRFWSQSVQLPEDTDARVVVEQAEVRVDVTAAGDPSPGTRVHLFDAGDGSYLGVTRRTDEAGQASFKLPVGETYRFRADLLGGRYWSGSFRAGNGTGAHVAAGGGELAVGVRKAPGEPMPGTRVHLFSGEGKYLGRSGETGPGGRFAFWVPEGTYKVRADLLGHSFWSGDILVVEDTQHQLRIPHRTASVRVVEAFGNETSAVSAARVHLFGPAKKYTGRSARTDENGTARFQLPDRAFAFRADYLGGRYWSGEAKRGNATVEIGSGWADVRVSAAGRAREGVRVHVFDHESRYLGRTARTGASGTTGFLLPAGSYLFRADLLGGRFWSPETELAAGLRHAAAVDAGGGDLVLEVRTGLGEPVAGARCHVFGAQGSYLGLSGATNKKGLASFELPEGSYGLRVDYLGHRFRSETVRVPEQSRQAVVIEQEPVTARVLAGGEPWEDARVCLFSTDGSYLGRCGRTQGSGRTVFDLPAGRSFKLRADVLGGRYTGDAFRVEPGAANEISIDVGGGDLGVRVKEQEGSGLRDVPVHLFSEARDFLGPVQRTGPDGRAAFRVPGGSFKVRADYLGYSFWSAQTQVRGDTEAAIAVPVREARVLVRRSFCGQASPVSGSKVHVLGPDGSSPGLSASTNASGRASFLLPEREYRAAADYLGARYEAALLPGKAGIIDIPLARAEVEVTGAGCPRAGLRVHVFRASGGFLGVSGETDGEGRASFLLPEGAYRFRVDYLDRSYWSAESELLADRSTRAHIDAGGGRVVVRLADGLGRGLQGVACHVFSPEGRYLGLRGATDNRGETSFDLPRGVYRFRFGYLGHEFWSADVEAAAGAVAEKRIAHRGCRVAVRGVCEGQARPLAGAEAHLFTEGGTYLGRSKNMNDAGEARFSLPDRPFRVRVDHLGRSYWSDPFRWSDAGVDIPEGRVEVGVLLVGRLLPGVQLYVFDEKRKRYLGVSGSTNGTGRAELRLPAGDYAVRADYQHRSFWGESAVRPGASSTLRIDTQGAEFVLRLDNGQGPIAGAKVHVFTRDEAYIGLSSATDEQGDARFLLSRGDYAFRADYLGHRFWSGTRQVPQERSGRLSIPHREVGVDVLARYRGELPLGDVRVHVFGPGGAYAGLSAATDDSGTARFFLPHRPFSYRAEHMGCSFRSEPASEDRARVIVPYGRARVRVVMNSRGVPRADVRVLRPGAADPGMSETTDSSGIAGFLLPAREWRFRAEARNRRSVSPAVELEGYKETAVRLELSLQDLLIPGKGGPPEHAGPGDRGKGRGKDNLKGKGKGRGSQR